MLMLHVMRSRIDVYELSVVVAVVRSAWSNIPKNIWKRLDDMDKATIQDFFDKIEAEKESNKSDSTMTKFA